MKNNLAKFFKVSDDYTRLYNQILKHEYINIGIEYNVRISPYYSGAKNVYINKLEFISRNCNKIEFMNKQYSFFDFKSEFGYNEDSFFNFDKVCRDNELVYIEPNQIF
jgi:hypothetical protein